ncbi:hypothetical protein CERSUDRAFT_100705 [Gelatoporia subvermispora B]|uniref:Ribonuclease H1 N-terminal domain-containing protein n=1 Tax=Ceriporiopsis subvermispora (strain B) TaxID=914234 RepID=M2QX06_CERS8|nr:hypothetical protein CERSUDRAFT_100705 [Gelatoporia subvermispora B]
MSYTAPRHKREWLREKHINTHLVCSLILVALDLLPSLPQLLVAMGGKGLDKLNDEVVEDVEEIVQSIADLLRAVLLNAIENQREEDAARIERPPSPRRRGHADHQARGGFSARGQVAAGGNGGLEHMMADLTNALVGMHKSQAKSDVETTCAGHAGRGSGAAAPNVPLQGPPQGAPAANARTYSNLPEGTVHIAPPRETNRWYVVTRGRLVGVFDTWASVAPHVIGVHSASFMRVGSRQEALAMFDNAYDTDGVAVIPM